MLFSRLAASPLFRRTGYLIFRGGTLCLCSLLSRQKVFEFLFSLQLKFSCSVLDLASSKHPVIAWYFCFVGIYFSLGGNFELSSKWCSKILNMKNSVKLRPHSHFAREKQLSISTVRSTIQTNPSRKCSF